MFAKSILIQFCMTGLAFAQDAAPVANPGVRLMGMLPMFVIVFAIFYFMVLRPQNQRLQAHKKLLEELKKGQTVTTSSGMQGKVFAIEEDFVTLEVASNVRVKFEKDHISKKI